MNWFYKRQTLIRTICFMAFFVAINVICSFMTTLLPLFSAFLIIFLPLTSTIVEINCKDRWFPIYAIATVGLSIVVTLSSIDITLFYVVPSIFTGYIFGLFAKRDLPKMYAIFLSTILQTLLSYMFIPLLNLIADIDLIDLFAKMFRISDIFLFKTTILLLFFLLSLVQIVLSFIVVENELKKFNQHFEELKNEEQIAGYSSIGCSLLAVIFSFIYLPLTYLFVGFSFFFATFVIFNQAKVNKVLPLILDAVSLFIGLLLFALLNNLFDIGYSFTLLAIPTFLIGITSMLYSFLKKSPQ